MRIIHSEEFLSLTDAVSRERQLKRWTVEKKEALIVGGPSRLKSWKSRGR